MEALRGLIGPSPLDRTATLPILERCTHRAPMRHDLRPTVITHETPKKEERRSRELPLFECDANFAYIVGDTSAGFPYGVTWDEWKGPHLRNEEEDAYPSDHAYPSNEAYPSDDAFSSDEELPF